MPYTIRKLPRKSCYRVKNTKTRKIFAKCTSLKKAKAQLRLLHQIERNERERTVRTRKN
jgi:hypothetical protein